MKEGATHLTLTVSGQDLEVLRELAALLERRSWCEIPLGDVARELIRLQGPVWAEQLRRGEDE